MNADNIELHRLIVADWIDAVQDSRLPTKAQITAYALAHLSDGIGSKLLLIPVQLHGVIDRQPNRKRLNGPSEEIAAAGLATLARAGFLNRGGRYLEIPDSSKWNRGQGPTKLRA